MSIIVKGNKFDYNTLGGYDNQIKASGNDLRFDASVGDIYLNTSGGEFKLSGRGLNLDGGELHNIKDLSGVDNTTLLLTSNQSFILKSNNVNRLTIDNAGLITFQSIPQCSITPTTSNHLINNSIFLPRITSYIPSLVVGITSCPLTVRTCSYSRYGDNINIQYTIVVGTPPTTPAFQNGKVEITLPVSSSNNIAQCLSVSLAENLSITTIDVFAYIPPNSGTFEIVYRLNSGSTSSVNLIGSDLTAGTEFYIGGNYIV